MSSIQNDLGNKQEENDDLPVGRVLNRREVLALFGVLGAGALAGCSLVTRRSGPGASSSASFAAPTAIASNTLASAPVCIVSPELTVGPYFVDEKLNRSDVRTDPANNNALKEGRPLELTFRVSQVGSAGCTVLSNAQVDIWHCDVQGAYSDVNDPGFNTKGQQWLRGYQVTDSNGIAKFTTIYPGWYSSRAVHIHFKVRGTSATSNKSYEFVSQLFFDETTTDAVHAQAPYAAKGKRDTLNSTDSVFSQGNSNNLVLAAVKTATGYAASFDVGVNL